MDPADNNVLWRTLVSQDTLIGQHMKMLSHIMSTLQGLSYRCSLPGLFRPTATSNLSPSIFWGFCKSVCGPVPRPSPTYPFLSVILVRYENAVDFVSVFL